jgi:hypothetical protein
VRLAIAENARLPITILEAVAADENGHVASLARNTINKITPCQMIPMPAQNTKSSKKAASA